MNPPGPLYVPLMLASIAVGVAVASTQPRPVGLSRMDRAAVLMGAVIGGTFASKVPFLLMDVPHAMSSVWVFFENGRTITYGLVGGYLGVEVAKLVRGIQVKTGDTLAVSVAASVAVGRLACFAGHCCYGTETSLPWGVDFGDGVRRHPTQLYEFCFHLGAVFVLLWLGKRDLFPRQRIKLYIASYLVYRFVTEWIRPEPRGLGGLTFYQWSVPPMLLLFAVLAWWDRPGRAQASMGTPGTS